MSVEKKYEFRKRLLVVHQKNIRDHAILPREDEFSAKDGCRIVIGKDASEVIVTAAKDFADFLFTSMNVSAMVSVGAPAAGDILIATAAELGADYADIPELGYRIEANEYVTVCGYDDRRAAQGMYLLEDMMSAAKAPHLKKERIDRKLRFSPRMLHSGYGMDEFPREYLSAIAHAGRDAIMVFTKEAEMTPSRFLDFNNLIADAAKYGIDVYAYSYLKVTMHPEEKGAEAAYDAAYGKLFKNCPGFKGIVLVGESVEFESKDPHVGQVGTNGTPAGQLFSSKPRPGWWPCCDFPQWIDLVKRTVRKYNADADIVFWTYNWGYAPEEDRIRLIESLPTDISLLATFEMFESYEKDGVIEYTSDYTIVREGPGKYFTSEAIAAKKRGIRFYGMTNTGGMTWDMGTIPYMPVPQQWIKRYKSMIRANEEWDLCGLMESHHYGFYPSFIGDLSGRVFDFGADTPEEELKKVIVKHFGSAYAEQIEEALSCWSDAMADYTCHQDDQYGPWRGGPAYPLLYQNNGKRGHVVRLPDSKYAHWGSLICYTTYPCAEPSKAFSPFSLRCPKEIGFLRKARAAFERGIAILEAIPEPGEALQRLLNLGKFMSNTITTGIHAKQWYIAKSKIAVSDDASQSLALLDELEAIGEAEIKNAEATIPLVEFDSRLGWEAAMEYIAHRENLEWKIRYMRFVIDTQLKNEREAFMLTK